MIVIRIEIWPRGSFAERKTIAVGTIVNNGGTVTRGEYIAKFYGAGSASSGDIQRVYDKLARDGHVSRQPWRVAFPKNFPRKVEGAWSLLMGALIEAVSGFRRVS